MLPKPPLLRGGGPPAGGGGVWLDDRALRKKQQTRTTTARCRKSIKPGEQLCTAVRAASPVVYPSAPVCALGHLPLAGEVKRCYQNLPF